jgi:catechol 2,3-dioxygenase-like lactoylglutathione lyase family enzyme
MNNYYIFILLILFHLIGNIKLIEASENSTIENDNIMLQDKKYENLLKLAKTGDKKAQNDILKVYSDGIGKDASIDEAIDWFEKALSFSSKKYKKHNDTSTTFLRSTIVCKISDLERSIVFWRDVMGFEFFGKPSSSVSGSSSLMGWDHNTKRSFTSFKSQGGSTIALLIIEDEDFKEIKLSKQGTAFNDVILVHEAINIKQIYDRAIKHKVEIIKPYGPSGTGKSIQIFLRAPTGHFVEIYEIIS